MIDKIRWGWQRLTRGWDDRVIWSIDIHLARMIPIWLQALKEDKMGVPSNLCTKSVEDGEEIWDDILDTIIKGFLAAQRIQNLDFPILKELRELEKERFGKLLLPWNEEEAKQIDQLNEELGVRDKLMQQQDEADQEFRKGMILFQEHFFSLWS